jgi:hypothetical protein
VGDLPELGKRGAAHTLAGGIRSDQVWILTLQGQQLLVKVIILAVGYLGVIQDIIAVGMIL